MLDTLRAQHATFQKFATVTENYRHSERLPVGIRLTLGIYLQILSDAISTLTAMIEYLDRDPTYGDMD